MAAGRGARAGRPRRPAGPLSRRSCPAASSSAWRSRAPSPSGPRCCSATSRPARSTARPAAGARGDRARQPRARHHDRGHHPQRGHRRAWPTASCWSCATAASQRGATRHRAALPRELVVVKRHAPLDRKLLRDLWRLRSQALAIALVVACGVGAARACRSRRSSAERRARRPTTTATASPTSSRA